MKYEQLLNKIIHYIEESKLRAFSEVNKILLRSCWDIGKELSKSVVDKLSEDLRLRYPKAKGFSPRNLWNMKRFYAIYQNLQTVSGDLLFSISWSNHVSILDNLSNKIKQLENINIKKEEIINQLKQSILQKAFNGELTGVAT